MRQRAVIILAFCICWLVAESVAAQLPELIGEIPADTAFALLGHQLTYIGDQDNDGRDDLLANRGAERTHYMFFGGEPVDTIPDRVFSPVNLRSSRIGDVNGDTYIDIHAQWHLDARTYIFFGGPDGDAVADLVFGTDTLYGMGHAVRGHDIDANDADEIVVWSIFQNSLLFYEIGGAYDSLSDFVLYPANVDIDRHGFGAGLVAGDFNGDGRNDLAVGLNPNYQFNTNGSVYLYWGGPTFDTIPDLIVPRPGPWIADMQYFGRVLAAPGDVNGDGYDDFIASTSASSNDTLAFVYFGGPEIDSIPDVTIAQPHGVISWAGDLNTDGYNDFLISYPLPWSGAGDVRVYYGGPDIDSIADLVIRNVDMPEYQTEFGMDCTGVGDFNGDGIDDFAFSARTSGSAKIYIFSGTNVMDVERDDDPNLPDEFSLSQNYPNPFNPSTTIEFDTPERSRVKLSVHNILGQRVVTLLDRVLSAGSHQVTWDGKDAQGRAAASGVYLYKLSTSESNQTRKMLLLK